MTKEEAIATMICIKGRYKINPVLNKLEIEAIDMAIKALSTPYMTEADFDSYKLGYEQGKAVATHGVSGDLISREDAEPVRHGRWVEDEEQTHIEKTYHCSECDFKAWGKAEKTIFCGGCGAKMDGDTE